MREDPGVRRREHLSLAAARRIALVAKGFADPRPRGTVDRRLLRRVLVRTRVLQIDSVNVFARAHYLPAFSRLGRYSTAALDDLAYRHRELFEYWAHEACLVPVELQPLLRWRMDRARSLEEGWGGILRVMREQPDFVASVLELVRERGPIGAGALREGPRGASSWWGWDRTKMALEYLFWSGQVTTASRRSFERLYDLTERVLPSHILAAPTPSREEAQIALVRQAAASLGVATARDLRDYFRLRPAEAQAALHSLVDAGELSIVEVEGWPDPAYLWPGVTVPRRVPASTLLSPFDPLVWDRARAARLFGFDYRIEIYVPAAKRVHGYYSLPFLHEEDIVARVDLKADRKGGVLRVLSAWAEPGRPVRETADALLPALRSAAEWQGLGTIEVALRGDLAPHLRALVSYPAQGTGW